MTTIGKYRLQYDEVSACYWRVFGAIVTPPPLFYVQ
jgi:hypothetical protein